MHSCFGDAVHVDKLWIDVTVTLEPGLKARHVQRFATKDNVAQSQFLRLRVSLLQLDQLAKRAGRLVQNRDFLSHEQFIERIRRPRYQVRHNDKSPAIK